MGSSSGRVTPATLTVAALAADVAQILVGEPAELAVRTRAAKLLPQRADALFYVGGLGDANVFGDNRVEDWRVDAGNGIAAHAHHGLLVESAGGAEARDDDAQ